MKPTPFPIAIAKVLAVLATLAGPLFLSGCNRWNESAAPQAPPLPPITVQIQSVTPQRHVVVEEVMGTVRSKVKANLEAKLSGRIIKFPFVVGQTVRPGELVAQLEAPDSSARLEQAEAALEQAEREWKRNSALFEQKAATRVEFEGSQTRLRLAKGAVAEAKAMVNYLQILAPFAGVVTAKAAEIGDQAVPGKLLLTLEDPFQLQVEADLPLALASRVHRPSRLNARVDGNPDLLTVQVSEISPAADPVTRTLRVKFELPETAGLKAGQFARLLVPVGERDIIRVPHTVVIQRGQLEIVFLVGQHHARLQLVKTGPRVGQEVEILAGLHAGDVVVVAGAERLSDGQPLEVK